MATALQEKLRKQVTTALTQFRMIDPDDKILVAVSGGKDSSSLLLLLREVQRRAPFPFEITPAILDQNQPGFDLGPFRNWLQKEGFQLTVLTEDTYSIVTTKTASGKSYCGLCSRLRRGILYTYARKNGYTKIALGHHRDDLNETALLNLFYGGKFATMPPYMEAQNGYSKVIRPLALCAESEIQEFARQQNFPIIPCRLCGSQEGSKRQKIKSFLREMEKEYGEIGATLFAALGRIEPGMLLDPRLRTDKRGIHSGEKTSIQPQPFKVTEKSPILSSG